MIIGIEKRGVEQRYCFISTKTILKKISNALTPCLNTYISYANDLLTFAFICKNLIPVNHFINFSLIFMKTNKRNKLNLS